MPLHVVTGVRGLTSCCGETRSQADMFLACPCRSGSWRPARCTRRCWPTTCWNQKWWKRSWPCWVTQTGECSAQTRILWDWRCDADAWAMCFRESDLTTVRASRNQLCDWLGVPQPQLIAKVTWQQQTFTLIWLWADSTRFRLQTPTQLSWSPVTQIAN